MTNRLIGLVATCAVIAACSSSSSGGGGGGGGVSAEQACTDLAAARCTKLQTCANIRLETAYASVSDCEALYVPSCTAALQAAATGNTAADSEACAQAYSGWACTDYLNDVNVPAACATEKGQLANNAACAYPAQCQSGFCAIAPSSACGTCAAPPQAGASCAELTTCGPGLTCTGDTQQCVALAASGASCGKGAPCGSGLVCIGADTAKNVMGKCAMGITQSGTACDPTLAKGPGCSRDAGLTCNSASKTCQNIVVANAGSPCGEVMNQTADCSAAATCVGATATKSGKCTAPAADGATCAPPNPGCQSLSRCISTGAASGDAAATGTCAVQNASSCH
jgi:hypothetical protein